jgi:hypothetical protein
VLDGANREQCDMGAANGTSSYPCRYNCTFYIH